MRTIRHWLKNDKFRSLVEETFRRLEEQDSKKHRAFANKLITKSVYDELMKRIMDGGLQDMSMGALLRTVKDLNFENRLDDGEATGRTEHKHILDDLTDRFREIQGKGNSGELPDGQNLRLIEAPRKKEKSNG